MIAAGCGKLLKLNEKRRTIDWPTHAYYLVPIRGSEETRPKHHIKTKTDEEFEN